MSSGELVRELKRIGDNFITVEVENREYVIDTIELNEKEKREAEQRIKELITEIEVLEEKVKQTSIRLSALQYKEKEILYAYYIENRTYEDIGNNLYFSLFNQTREIRAIKSIVKNATNKMLKL